MSIEHRQSDHKLHSLPKDNARPAFGDALKLVSIDSFIGFRSRLSNKIFNGKVADQSLVEIVAKVC